MTVRTHRPWDDAEDGRLCWLVTRQGYGYRESARRLERAYADVRRRCLVLALASPLGRGQKGAAGERRRARTLARRRAFRAPEPVGRVAAARLGEPDAASAREAVLLRLLRLEGPRTTAQLAALRGVTGEAVRTALCALWSRGLVTRRRRTEGKARHWLWSLPGPPPAPEPEPPPPETDYERARRLRRECSRRSRREHSRS